MRTYNKLASRVGLGLIVAFTLAAGGLLSGCVSKTDVPGVLPASTAPQPVSERVSSSVYKITDTNGTVCYVYVAYYGGGISCLPAQQRLSDTEFYSITSKGGI